MTVLIAEDEKPLSMALKLKLSKEGYNALVAANGAEALDLVEKNSVDLILLDLVMPEMDGFAFMQALQEKGVKLPIVVLTNLSQGEDLEKAKQFGAIDYFVKANTPIKDIVDYVKNFKK